MPLSLSIDFLNVIFICNIIVELFIGFAESKNLKKLYYFIASTVLSLIIVAINAKYILDNEYISVFNFFNMLCFVFFSLSIISLIAAIVIVFRLSNWSQSEWDEKKTSDQKAKSDKKLKKKEYKTLVSDAEYERKVL